MELEEIRAKIDTVDEEILRLFLERMTLAEEVAVYKKARQLPILNEGREREILDRVARQAGDRGEDAKQLFSTLFSISRTRQAQLMEG